MPEEVTLEIDAAKLDDDATGFRHLSARTMHRTGIHIDEEWRRWKERNAIEGLPQSTGAGLRDVVECWLVSFYSYASEIIPFDVCGITRLTSAIVWVMCRPRPFLINVNRSIDWLNYLIHFIFCRIMKFVRMKRSTNGKTLPPNRHRVFFYLCATELNAIIRPNRNRTMTTESIFRLFSLLFFTFFPLELIQTRR